MSEIVGGQPGEAKLHCGEGAVFGRPQVYLHRAHPLARAVHPPGVPVKRWSPQSSLPPGRWVPHPLRHVFPGSLALHCESFHRTASRRQNLSSQSSLCNHHGDLGLEPSWFPMLVKAALHPHQCPLAIATLVKVLGRTEACIFCSRLGRRPAAGRSPLTFCRRGVTLLSGDAPTPVTKGFRLPSTPRQGFLPGGMTGKTKRPQPKLRPWRG